MESKRRQFRRKPGKFLLIAGIVVALTAIAGTGAYAALGGAPKSGANSGDVDLQRGAIGVWEMNGNAKDSTPYTHNGTVAGGAALSADRKGGANAAYNFNGTSQYITVPYAAATQPAKVSVSAWFNTSAFSSSRQAIVGNTELGGYSLAITGSTASGGCAADRLCFQAWDGTAYRVAQVATSTLTPGAWTHVTGSFDGTKIVLYVNGAQVASTTISFSVVYALTTPVCIGNEATATACTGASFFNGKLDSVRLWNRGLNAAEAAALYKSYDAALQVMSGAGGLLGHWKMDSNALDSTPNANNGMLFNTPSPAADRKGNAGAAYVLNGTNQYIQVPYASVIKPTAAITVSAWIKPTSSTLSSVAAQVIASTSEQGGYQLVVAGTSASAQCPANTLCFQVHNGTTYIYAQVPRSTLAADLWTQVVGTYDGTTVALYRDGALMASSASAPASISYAHTNPQCIGAEATTTGCGGGMHFNGSVDDVKLYGRALSLPELTAQYKSYNSQITVSDLQKGLAYDFPMNGNAKDATPFASNATANGLTLTTDRKDRANSAYSSTGTSQSLSTSAANLPTAAITVGMWVNISVLANWYDLFSKDWTASGKSGINLHVDATGTLIFGVSVGVGQYNARCPSGSIKANTWNHIVGTYDGTTVRVYVNGEPCATTATVTTSLSINAGTIEIGDGGVGLQSYKMDDARIYNRALQAPEVKMLHDLYR